MKPEIPQPRQKQNPTPTAATWLAVVLLFILSGPAMAIDEPPYRVLESAPPVEIREYPAYAVAETRVVGKFDDVGNEGFRRLFGYISGDNRGSVSIAMTAPVTQQADGDAYRIAFVLPAKYTAATAPLPANPEVRILEVPARNVVALRYTGRWSEANYQEGLAALMAFAQTRKLALVGEPVYARYDPPFMPWFLRRNEILIEIAR